MTTTTDKMLSPPQLAKRYGVDVAKVLKWINAGELRAVNVATKPGGNPRWKITAEAIADFERRRMNVPPAEQGRRNRREAAREYF